MPNSTEKYLRMSNATTGGIGGTFTNTPPQYETKRKGYMEKATRDFAALRAEYASDVQAAECQGINPDDFYEFVETDVRLSDVGTENSTKLFNNDDKKEVMFFEPYIEYFPVGAKLVTAGSTWLCVNPSNISSVYCTAVLTRCNASYNSYDEYGNVVVEPIIVENYQMASNENQTPNNMVLMDGNFRIICQKNANTEKLDINKRIILGKKVYYITGFTDFLQEFSGDRDSVHLMTFTARLDETVIDDDDFKDFVADADDYRYSAEIIGATQIQRGGTGQLTAVLTLNGEKKTDRPTHWMWRTSNKDIVDVDKDGIITAYGVNQSCTISANLIENPDITAKIPISIVESPGINVEFIGLTSSAISQYFTESYTAAFFVNGNVETYVPITWNFTNAPEDCYEVIISSDTKTATVKCLKPSSKKLKITASSQGLSAIQEVELCGY